MRNILIGCLSSLILGATSCDTEEDPTTFRGEVTFLENSELKEKGIIKVLIRGYKSKGIGTPDDGVASADITLDTQNQFEKIFPSIEVDDYALGVDIIDSDSTVIASLRGNDLDCSPYDCSNLQPGRTYDLTVRVIE